MHWRQTMQARTTHVRTTFLLCGMLAWLSGVHQATAQPRDWANVVKPPIISPAQKPVSHYYIEFRARYGPGAITGHLHTRTIAVLKSGKRKLTSLFGLYSIGGALTYPATFVGTHGMVGYTHNDLHVRPVERYRIRISSATHARVLKAARYYSTRLRWFELFQTNCNYLAGRVARLIGLRTPTNLIQLPDDYLRQLRTMNSRK